ncbi:MAG: methionyl-tRNA formyltransferase [Bacteroidota bacterium]|nr:methionyl-tRNA formyltransferase [Bacteroidota bacterium]
MGLKVVFFGTPDFAVASLDALVQNGFDVLAVVTAPDKPAGRGMQLQASAVKQYALDHQLPILQPEKLKDPQFIATLQDLAADVHIVVAFRMLPEVVWNMPKQGTINVHGSLLPQYRGAAPINWAIMNGETETGVTTFRLKHQIDTGNILLQSKTPIFKEDNFSTVYQRLMLLGAELLVTTLRQLEAGTLQEVPQDTIDETTLKHAPKLFKENLQLDFNKPAAALVDFIRGLAPFPTAYTFLEQKQLKVFQSHAVNELPAVAIGTMQTDAKSYIRFACKDAWLYIDELQLEGKKRMETVAFLRGFRFSE